MQILKVVLELDGAKKIFMINNQIATKRLSVEKRIITGLPIVTLRFFQKGIK